MRAFEAFVGFLQAGFERLDVVTHFAGLLFEASLELVALFGARALRVSFALVSLVPVVMLASSGFFDVLRQLVHHALRLLEALLDAIESVIVGESPRRAARSGDEGEGDRRDAD